MIIWSAQPCHITSLCPASLNAAMLSGLSVAVGPGSITCTVLSKKAG